MKLKHVIYLITMNKFMLVVAGYEGEKKKKFNSFSKNNQKYCDKYNIEYIEHSRNVKPIRGKFNWVKPFFVNDLLNNKLKENDILICLDADLAICNFDQEFDLDYGKSFGYAIDSANTHNTGFYIIRNNSWSRKMISLTIDEERYKYYINKKTYHERFKNHSVFWDDLVDQASWYSLAGIKRHSDISFWELKNYGWNSDCDEKTIYDVKDLEENVQLFDSRYNVTEISLETDGTFNINKVAYYKVINRHFAGNQKWNTVWLNPSFLKISLYYLNPFRVIKFLYIKNMPKFIGKFNKIIGK